MGGKLKFLITGGNGFLGSNLVHKLIEENHNVLVFSKNHNNLDDILDKCVFISSYMNEILSYTEDIINFSPDVIVHFGWDGGNNYKSTNSLDQFHNNIPDNIRFLDFINSLPKKPKFIGIGSFAEYGQVTSLTSENVEESPISFYGTAKLILKQYSKIFCLKNNIDWVWIRPCFVYGPKDVSTRLIPSLILKCLKNEDIILDECKTIIDVIYIKDFIELTYNLIINNNTGVYNISSGITYPLKEIINNIYKLTNSKSNITFDPEKNRKLAQLYVSADNTKIKETTGISPQYSLIDGLKNTIKYYEL
jgi:nucleoside-diphosphate-sugar epimerase